MIAELAEKAQHLAGSNSFLSGGFILMVLGGILAPLRSLPNKIWRWCRYRILVTVQIDNTDPCYPWVRAWVSAHGKARFFYGGTMPEDTLSSGEISSNPKFVLFPGGVATFRFKGKRLITWMSRSEVAQSKDYRESIIIQFFSLFRSKKLFQDILDASHKMVVGDDGTTIEVFIPSGSYWKSMGRRPGRSIDSLILDDGKLEWVMDDVRKFMDEREWYAKMGISWRRTYLLHGPPGTGKSTLALVMATEFRRSLYVASIAEYFDGETLMQSMARIPPDSILLLEDVDRVSKGDKQIATSAVLNVLDGVVAKEGRILIMTTNHIDKLDAALIRSGRVDLKVEIGNATASQVERLFLRFFPGRHEEATIAGCNWEGRSMADIQEHFLRHRDNPSRATTCVDRVNATQEEVGCAA